jgi:hypothetical protein
MQWVLLIVPLTKELALHPKRTNMDKGPELLHPSLSWLSYCFSWLLLAGTSGEGLEE